MRAKGMYETDQGSVESDLVVINGSLYIYLQDARKSLVVWDFRMVSACRFDGGVLTVEQNFPRQKVITADHMAAAIYEEYLSEVNGKKKLQRRTRVFLVIALFALALMAFVWFAAIPWLAERLSGFIPVETEIAIGKHLGEAVVEQNRINDSASYFLQQFVDELERDETYPIDAAVIESDEINAFALPGGKIFVYSGILRKMNSYEQLAALMGHEISHVTNRHSLRSMSRSTASSLVLSSVFGDAGGLSVDLIGKINDFKSLHYSRELETEADSEGLQVLIQNKIRPQGMLDLLKLLKQAGEKQPGIMQYLSTHPDTDARIEQVRQQLKGSAQGLEHATLQNIFLALKRQVD